MSLNEDLQSQREAMQESKNSLEREAILRDDGEQIRQDAGGQEAPDVCWNKPFKEKILLYYATWMSNGDRQEFTAAGNPEAPLLEVVLDWVDHAWQDLSKKMVIKYFEVCALTIPTDGSGDDKIGCFKAEVWSY